MLTGGGSRIQVTGMQQLLQELRGGIYKDVNRDLRATARATAATVLAPLVADGVRQSQAPQAAQMAATIRAHSDRVPVVVVGKVNPRFATNWAKRGGVTPSKKRRGAMALGVVAGGAGGRRDTDVAEDYYHVPRSLTWGPLGDLLRSHGHIIKEMEDKYIQDVMAVLKHHGWVGHVIANSRGI